MTRLADRDLRDARVMPRDSHGVWVGLSPWTRMARANVNDVARLVDTSRI